MFGLSKKDKLGEVLGSLAAFSGDAAGFERLRKSALAFFGPSWQFSLEMYLLSLPAGEQAAYLPQFRRAMRYARAASLWLSAQRLLSGEEGFGQDAAKEAEEYAEYLPLFGDAGKKLLDELFARFKIGQPEEARRPAPARESAPSPNPKPKPAHGPETRPKPAPMPELSAEPAPEPSPREVSGPSPEPAPETRPKPESMPEAGPESAPEPPPSEVSESRPEPGPEAKDWRAVAFDRVVDFLSSAREVMSAMVVEKGYAALEDYPGYVLLRDAADYAVSLGAKLKTPDAARRLALLKRELADEITIEKQDGTK
ncbi:MAG: hypothetical protein LBT92_02965 [Rickettsiales bacterium]|jgi:hypothetical protein|nr:hypothetical protein [Rickettsiales bacterium]